METEISKQANKFEGLKELWPRAQEYLQSKHGAEVGIQLKQWKRPIQTVANRCNRRNWSLSNPAMSALAFPLGPWREPRPTCLINGVRLLRQPQRPVASFAEHWWLCDWVSVALANQSSFSSTVLIKHSWPPWYSDAFRWTPSPFFFTQGRDIGSPIASLPYSPNNPMKTRSLLHKLFGMPPSSIFLQWWFSVSDCQMFADFMVPALAVISRLLLLYLCVVFKSIIGSKSCKAQHQNSALTLLS